MDISLRNILSIRLIIHAAISPVVGKVFRPGVFGAAEMGCHMIMSAIRPIRSASQSFSCFAWKLIAAFRQRSTTVFHKMDNGLNGQRLSQSTERLPGSSSVELAQPPQNFAAGTAEHHGDPRNMLALAQPIPLTLSSPSLLRAHNPRKRAASPTPSPTPPNGTLTEDSSHHHHHHNPRRRLRQCFFLNSPIGSCTPSTSEYYRLAFPPSAVEHTAPSSSTTSPTSSRPSSASKPNHLLSSHLSWVFQDAVSSAGLMDKYNEAIAADEELWACHAHFVWSWTDPSWRDSVCQHLFADWAADSETHNGSNGHAQFVNGQASDHNGHSLAAHALSNGHEHQNGVPGGVAHEQDAMSMDI
ncbi:hypothetical protein DFS34DRAFT_224326 [Phlyctochytrium arcticum]|nr:hypothetical protein DFS34DRAFT_224326 [Phlyctochytrium arcticum]